VERPELARPSPGAEEVLGGLCDRVVVVAILTGRPTQQVRDLIHVQDLTIVGLYGLAEDEGRDRILAAMEEVERAATLVPGAWVEDKGASLTVHYRAADDPVGAQAVLRPALEAIARKDGLTLFEGKMVVEVATGSVPGKGAVANALIEEHDLNGCLYAGDDQPDLDAFAALDHLAAAGLAALKVAVRSAETPDALIASADLVVESPAELVRMLSEI
jgi:trehalose 6-phosphate phosphatase